MGVQNNNAKGIVHHRTWIPGVQARTKGTESHIYNQSQVTPTKMTSAQFLRKPYIHLTRTIPHVQSPLAHTYPHTLLATCPLRRTCASGQLNGRRNLHDDRTWKAESLVVGINLSPAHESVHGFAGISMTTADQRGTLLEFWVVITVAVQGIQGEIMCSVAPEQRTCLDLQWTSSH